MAIYREYLISTSSVSADGIRSQSLSSLISLSSADGYHLQIGFSPSPQKKYILLEHHPNRPNDSSSLSLQNGPFGARFHVWTNPKLITNPNPPTSRTWVPRCVANERAAAVSGPLGVENARAGAFHQLLSAAEVWSPCSFPSRQLGRLFCQPTHCSSCRAERKMCSLAGDIFSSAGMTPSKKKTDSTLTKMKISWNVWVSGCCATMTDDSDNLQQLGEEQFEHVS